MASAISHFLVGAAIGLVAERFASARKSAASDDAERSPIERPRLALPWLTGLLAAAPDLDVAMHAFVAYSHPFGHRGVFHSLAFYALLSALIAALPALRPRYRVHFTALLSALASHSLLDMLTDGGLGILLFWPLADERLFFDWRPFPVSPLSIAGFLSERGLFILTRELPFTLPVFLLAWSQRVRPLTEARAAAGSDASPTSDDAVHSAPDGDVAVLEITDSIDLHHFAPRDVLSVVDAYLEAAVERGFEEVRLIHGRGKGVQRARVQQLLRSHPLVRAFRDAPPSRGGLGATIAWLELPNATEAGSPSTPRVRA